MRRSACVAARWLACVLCLLSASGAAAVGSGRALLIGINEYAAVPDLRGALNDIDLIQQVLVSRYEFRPANITRLTNEQATRAGILAAFERFAASVGPDDFVFIHYSGHGSQAADVDKDEGDDGKDETILSTDARTPGVADITDDELGDLLAKVKSKRVVIVLDSCHSGTATRGLSALRSRAVPEDMRVELYDRPRTRAVVPLAEGGHLLFTGAANTQEALDGPVDGRLHGLFTYSLARSIASAPAQATPRAVFSGAQRELHRIQEQLGLRSMPEPQLEAEPALLDAPLFAATASEQPARLPWVPASPLGGGQVRLVGGVKLGAVAGSLWAVYPAGERAFTAGGALAEAEVLSLRDGDAIARLEPRDAQLADGARAIALTPAPAGDRVPVRLLGDDAHSQQLRAALAKQLPAIQFVGPSEFARFEVQIEGGRCRVLGADGRHEVASFDAADQRQLETSLAALLARSMTAAELLALDNPATSLDLALEIVAAPPKSDQAGESRSVVVVPDLSARRFRIRHAGEPRSAENSLQVRARAASACYFTLVDVDAEGGVNVLFPNAVSVEKGYAKDGLIARGSALLVPDSIAPANQAGFYLDYAPPAGSDTLRGFCFADLTGAEELRKALAELDGEGSATRGVGGRAALRNKLTGGLRERLARYTSRGVRISTEAAPSEAMKPPEAPTPAKPETPSAPPPDWAGASLVVQVVE